MEAFNKPIVFVIEDLVGLHDLARTKLPFSCMNLSD